MQEDAAGKKLLAQTTTRKKIACLEKIFTPHPLQKNNGPSLILIMSQSFSVRMAVVGIQQRQDHFAGRLVNDGKDARKPQGKIHIYQY